MLRARAQGKGHKATQAVRLEKCCAFRGILSARHAPTGSDLWLYGTCYVVRIAIFVPVLLQWLAEMDNTRSEFKRRRLASVWGGSRSPWMLHYDTTYACTEAETQAPHLVSPC